MRSFWGYGLVRTVLVVMIPIIGASLGARAETEIYLGYGGASLTVLERTPAGIEVRRSEIGDMGERMQIWNQRVVAEEADDVLTLTLELLSPLNPTLSTRKWEKQDQQAYRKSRAEKGAYDKVWDDYQGRGAESARKYLPANIAYMHRVDDERLTEYFTLANDTPTTGLAACAPRLLELASALVKDHPDDAHVRVVFWDSLLRNRRYEELEKELPQWEARMLSATSKWLALSLYRVQWELDSIRATARGVNAYDLVYSMDDRTSDLQSIVKALDRAAKMSGYWGRNGNLTELVPKFFESQTLTKVVGTEAVFKLFQGRTREGFAELLGAYRLGQLLNAHGAAIDRMIGVSIRTIALARMQIVTLNACHSAEELKDLLRQFNELESSPPPLIGRSTMEILGIASPGYAASLLTRQGYTDARAVLFYAASAARLLQMQTGKLPQTEKELSSAFAKGLPQDPFVSAPIRLSIPREGNGITVYSVGPDKEDQHGWLVYDSTNGTLSTGDIVSQVPTKREFPFPNGPVHAYRREDLLAQFPNGLPRDSFANHTMRGLSISQTIPLRIFSFGPDMNEDEANHTDGRDRNDPVVSLPISPPTKYLPWGPYDPTNGMVSAGDLFVDIPIR